MMLTPTIHVLVNHVLVIIAWTNLDTSTIHYSLSPQEIVTLSFLVRPFYFATIPFMEKFLPLSFIFIHISTLLYTKLKWSHLFLIIVQNSIVAIN